MAKVEAEIEAKRNVEKETIGIIVIEIEIVEAISNEAIEAVISRDLSVEVTEAAIEAVIEEVTEVTVETETAIETETAVIDAGIRGIGLSVSKRRRERADIVMNN